MERRNFLKLLALGAISAVAATTLVETATAATPVDHTLDQLVERNRGEGEFAQRRRMRRMRRRMMRRRRRMMRRRFM